MTRPARIIRIPPLCPIITWTVGPKGMEFMHAQRRHVPTLANLIAAYVRDRGHGVRAFMC